MASACVPNIFKAMEMDGTAYWDGLFSQNPPVATFFKTDREQRPDEIWLITINPLKSKTIPLRLIELSEEIIDRLDYTSKLERDAVFIESLMDEGEKQATKFLK